MSQQYPSWEQVIHQLCEQLQVQEKKIRELEAQLKKLMAQVDELGKQPKVNIENIEYKFDQLKVEKLNGTLNIGLNPFSGEAIDDFSVINDAIKVKENDTSPAVDQNRVKHLEQVAEDFLYSEGMKIVRKIGKDLNVEVNDEVMKYILDDIRRQLSARIHFQQEVIIHRTQHPLTEEQLNEEVLAALKKDIEQAVEVFLINIPKEMGEEPK